MLGTGPVSTEDAARALAVPARTARAALRRLVTEGACRERRDGRHVLYEIEDTIFTEPTSPG